MMNPPSERRAQLIIELESIVGNSFYNGHIQNYGPGGVRESDGREIRYPVSFRQSNGVLVKYRSNRVPSYVSRNIILDGYYALGANRLHVMYAIERILKHLEARYGLVVDGKVPEI